MSMPSPPYCRLDLTPSLADQFINGMAPIDYSPVFLLKPFRFHLTMDTLSSNALTTLASKALPPLLDTAPLI